VPSPLALRMAKAIQSLPKPVKRLPYLVRVQHLAQTCLSVGKKVYIYIYIHRPMTLQTTTPATLQTTTLAG